MNFLINGKSFFVFILSQNNFKQFESESVSEFKNEQSVIRLWNLPNNWDLFYCVQKSGYICP